MYTNSPIERKTIKSAHWTDIGQGTNLQHVQPNMSQVVNETCMDRHAVPFKPQVSCAVPSIGQNLWRQLKRVQIPVFTGDKRTYQRWKAVFLACIDTAPATGQYKLLQLRQYLSGEALKVIENLGHSATAYEAAKERLERKYGGKRRQIAIYLEDLENFRQIRQGSARDLEHYVDLLDIAIINLKEAGLYELGDGSLYTKLQRKLPQPILASFQRWVFENNISESVAALRTWVIQESEFQTVASEMIHGLTGIAATSQPSQSFPQNNNQRAFFGETGNNYRSIKTVACQLCRKRHGIWKCQTFIEKNGSKRWNSAKLIQLCYRCLAEGHYGNSCPRSQPCGQNGCLKLHHRLLHQDDCQSEVTEQTQSNTEPNLFGNAEPNQGRPESGAYLVDSATSAMEGNGREKQTTMIAQECIETEFIALRIVSRHTEKWEPFAESQCFAGWR